MDDTSTTTSSVSEQTEPTNVLFVGNLSWNVDDNALAEFFTDAEAGFEPQKDETGMPMAKVILDRDRGNRSKGFGFVTFVDAETAEKAMNAKQGQPLMEREVRIQYKTQRAREDRPRRFNTERRFERRDNNRFDRGDRGDRYNRMAA